MTTIDLKELAKHAMEGLDPDFVKKSKGGIIIVAGENFGSGSSREQAPIALKYAETKCVIANSFARIFFRNAINIGLPVIESTDIGGKVENGDILSIDLTSGKVHNKTKDNVIPTQPLPDFIIELIEIGGLLNKLKKG